MDPLGGERTRCDVAIATPWVTVSRAEIAMVNVGWPSFANETLTFANIHDECTSNRRRVNPITRYILHLEPAVW